nr:unnamed protein product [Callosobruchus chinensis]
MFLIKAALHLIIDALLYLVNLSLLNGAFPSVLKTGKVIPIYKKGDNQNINNYRPITMPSVFSKVFEYGFIHRLLAFTEKYNIFSKNQHGFLSGKSTNTAVHSYCETLIQYIEQGECPVGIFCDLSKAFDCVDHKKLLVKLSSYGIRGNALNWVESFISNRQQFVSINNDITSDITFVNIGVAQGSVLGPFLFILYLNDLDKLDVSAMFTMDADDTSIIISHKDNTTLESKTNDILSKVNGWFIENGLFLNGTKTSAIRFHNRQKHCPPVSVNIGSQSISTEHFSEIKFLGLYLDANFNWKSHCEHLISKINSVSYLFINLKDLLTSSQLLMLYYAQVESRLRYGIRFWGMSTLAQDVFVSQKRSLRSMAGISRRETCRMLFRKYSILTVPALMILEMCLHVFKNRDQFCNVCDVHTKNTRQRENVYVPYKRYVVGYNSPDSLGLRFFNKLPFSIRNSSNKNLFKSCLKKLLVEHCIYDVNEFFQSTFL